MNVYKHKTKVINEFKCYLSCNLELLRLYREICIRIWWTVTTFWKIIAIHAQILKKLISRYNCITKLIRLFVIVKHINIINTSIFIRIRNIYQVFYRYINRNTPDLDGIFSLEKINNLAIDPNIWKSISVNIYTLLILVKST